MKNRLFTLLLCITAAINLSAQTKSLVRSDIIATMNDFVADLNAVFEQDSDWQLDIESICNTYGYAEYFIFNDKNMDSFQQWLEKYLITFTPQEKIQYSIRMLDQTLEKVDSNVKTDKRYKVDVILQRDRVLSHKTINISTDTLTVYAKWNAPKELTNILSITGKLKPLSQLIVSSEERMQQARTFLQNGSPEKTITILSTLIEEDNIEAAKMLADMYIKGYGVQKDANKAFQLWKDLAAKGNISALTQIGRCYEEGIGIEKNEKKAFEFYTKAAEQDDAEGQFYLGNCYVYRIGLNKMNHRKALEWYTKAAEQGYARAQMEVGIFYEKGVVESQDMSKANHWYSLSVDAYKKLAEQGDADAQYHLADLYYFGKGTIIDYQKAAEWFEKAAEQGMLRAQYNLAECYYEGVGVPCDKQKAVEWWTKAAGQGDRPSIIKIAYLHEVGSVVEQNPEIAAYWYTKYAATSDLFGEFYNKAGFLYLKSFKNDAAIDCFKKSIEQGSAKAMYNLGFCYEHGYGVSQDDKKAFDWYLKAAKKNNPLAQKKVASFYEKGRSVPRNKKKATEWYNKAEMNSYRY